MSQRRSLAGSLASSLAGSLADRSASAAAFSGPIDAMISAGGVAPKFFASISHRLYSAYAGPLFLLRRAGDDATTPATYDAATGLLDEVAVAAFCTTNNGYIVTPYDQSGNSNDVTQATTTRQPRIYDGATQLVLKQGSLPWAEFVTANVTHWSRGDSCGITGAEAVTLALFQRTPVAMLQWLMQVGTTAVRGGFSATQNASQQQTNQLEASTGRSFTTPTPTAASGYVHQIAAGATMPNSTIRKDGVDLVVAAEAAATTLNLVATAFTVGCRSTATFGATGGGCAWLADDSADTGAVRAAYEAFFAELKALS